MIAHSKKKKKKKNWSRLFGQSNMHFEALNSQVKTVRKPEGNTVIPDWKPLGNHLTINSFNVNLPCVSWSGKPCFYHN